MIKTDRDLGGSRLTTLGARRVCIDWSSSFPGGELLRRALKGCSDGYTDHIFLENQLH